MNELYNFKNKIIDYFSNLSELRRYTFSDEFPTKVKSNPLKGVQVVFYFSKISIPNPISSFIGKSITENKEIYGKIVELEMSFDIYSSFCDGSSACLCAFEAISEKMIKKFSFSSISSSSVSFNKSLSCFVLPCSCKISMIISEEILSSSISNFKIISSNL